MWHLRCLLAHLKLKHHAKGEESPEPNYLDTVIGYVNTSGNCPKHEPHVHIGVTTAALKPQKKYLNPTPFIRQSTPEGRRLLAEFQASVRSNRTAYLKLFREIEQKAL